MVRGISVLYSPVMSQINRTQHHHSVQTATCVRDSCKRAAPAGSDPCRWHPSGWALVSQSAVLAAIIRKPTLRTAAIPGTSKPSPS